MELKINANGYAWDTNVNTVEQAFKEIYPNPINDSNVRFTFENGYSEHHFYIDLEEDDGEEKADFLYQLHENTKLPYDM